MGPRFGGAGMYDMGFEGYDEYGGGMEE